MPEHALSLNSFIPLFIGVAFGILLQRAGLSQYHRIVNVFRFRDLTVLKFLLSALLSASIGIRLLQTLGLAGDVPLPSTFVIADLVGGLIFGAGMALSGFCPGTVAAGAGEGRLDYLIPGALGLFSGAVVYGLAYERIMPALTKWGGLGPVTFAGAVRVEPWLVILIFAELIGVTFYFVERRASIGRRAGAASS
jgi:hypothetical protein